MPLLLKSASPTALLLLSFTTMIVSSVSETTPAVWLHVGSTSQGDPGCSSVSDEIYHAKFDDGSRTKVLQCQQRCSLQPKCAYMEISSNGFCRCFSTCDFERPFDEYLSHTDIYSPAEPNDGNEKPIAELLAQARIIAGYRGLWEYPALIEWFKEKGIEFASDLYRLEGSGLDDLATAPGMTSRLYQAVQKLLSLHMPAPSENRIFGNGFKVPKVPKKPKGIIEGIVWSQEDGEAVCGDALDNEAEDASGTFTCWQRMKWVIANMEYTYAGAGEHIAEEFPVECGECGSEEQAFAEPEEMQVKVWDRATAKIVCGDALDNIVKEGPQLTCGERMEWVFTHRDSTYGEAGAFFAMKFPNECGACAGDDGMPFEPVKTICGDALDNAATDASGAFTCRQRMRWVVTNLEKTYAEAGEHIAEEFPVECGKCVGGGEAPVEPVVRKKICGDASDNAATDARGTFTCMLRVKWVVTELKKTYEEAGKHVAIQFPVECGPCAEVRVPVEPEFRTTICGDALDIAATDDRGTFTCRQRVKWVVTNLEKTYEEAGKHVAMRFPFECGPCAEVRVPVEPGVRRTICGDALDIEASDERGTFTCRQRLRWVVTNYEYTYAGAGEHLAEEFPEECGACAGGGEVPGEREVQEGQAKSAFQSAQSRLKIAAAIDGSQTAGAVKDTSTIQGLLAEARLRAGFKGAWEYPGVVDYLLKRQVHTSSDILQLDDDAFRAIGDLVGITPKLFDAVQEVLGRRISPEVVVVEREVMFVEPEVVFVEPEDVLDEPEVADVVEPEVVVVEPEAADVVESEVADVVEFEVVVVDPEVVAVETEVAVVDPEVVVVDPEVVVDELEVADVVEPEVADVVESEVMVVDPEVVVVEPEVVVDEPEVVVVEPEVVVDGPEVVDLEVVDPALRGASPSYAAYHDAV